MIKTRTCLGCTFKSVYKVPAVGPAPGSFPLCPKSQTFRQSRGLFIYPSMPFYRPPSTLHPSGHRLSLAPSTVLGFTPGAPTLASCCCSFCSPAHLTLPGSSQRPLHRGQTIATSPSSLLLLLYGQQAKRGSACLND